MKILNLIVAATFALSSVAYADKAVANLVKRAQQRDVAAMRTLGIRMYKGGSPGIPVDRKVALTWLNMAAEKNDEAALVFLGDIYAKGFHVAKNEKKAAGYYQEAAKLGNDKAVEGLNKLPVKYALEWHEENAETGNEYLSAIRLGEYYVDKGNDEKAHDYFKIAVTADREKAVKRMAKKNMGKAELFWRILADEFKDVDAAMLLADAYTSGLGVEPDQRKGADYYCVAASAGNATAVEMVKTLPFAYTVRWWKDKAEKGDLDAAFKLADAFEKGDGVEVDLEVAYEALDIAMNLDHSATMAWLDKRSLAENEGYFRHRAEEKEDMEIMMLLAKAYESGNGLAKNEEMATKMYCLASLRGNQEALNRIKDLPVGAALDWWQGRALNGDLDAMMRLAHCYEEGTEGVTASFSKAKSLYRRAADAGQKDAVAWMKDHDSSYKTPEETAEESREIIENALDRLNITSPQFLVLQNGRMVDKRIPLSSFSSADTIVDCILSMPVFQKVSANRYFCRYRDAVISVEVPSHLNVNFADDDVVHGILVRKGEFEYVNQAGYRRIIRNYILIVGYN